MTNLADHPGFCPTFLKNGNTIADHPAITKFDIKSNRKTEQTLERFHANPIERSSMNCPTCETELEDYSRDAITLLRERYAARQAGSDLPATTSEGLWYCPDCACHWDQPAIDKATSDKYLGLQAVYQESIRRKPGTVGGADSTGRAKKRKSVPGRAVEETVLNDWPERVKTRIHSERTAKVVFMAPPELKTQLQWTAQAMGVSVSSMLHAAVLKKIQEGGLTEVEKNSMLQTRRAVPKRGRPKKIQTA